jgi:uncharacterized membrane protein required for colicin V production
MTTTFNIFDLIFFAFTFIFVISAFFRGLIKEIFSLCNWIISLLLSYFLAPYASNILAEYFNGRIVLEGITRSVIFIISFITIALTTSDLRDSIRNKMPALFDKSLGVLFGFFKTLLIFGFIYSLYVNVYLLALGSNAEAQKPDWLTKSKSYSIIKFSGETLDPLIKTFFESISGNFDDLISQEDFDEKINEIIEEKSLDIEDIEDITKNSGYNKKDIEKMNHLINIIDK